MQFPALRDAALDADLAGAPLRVYLWLVTNHLDTVELRAVKVSGLAIAMHIERNTVTRALRLLTMRGYLERRYVERDGYHYRAYAVRKQPLVGQTTHSPPAA